MTANQIKALQERVGAKPDGFWGPKSIAATQVHLRSLMPTPNPWPKSNTRALNAFYGNPGEGEVALQMTRINVAGMGIKYAGKAVPKIAVHQRCSESLHRILAQIAESHFAYVLAEYAGVYNHRPMRGGTSWSLHAYGAAIDLMPGSNGLHAHWPTRATMPLEVMEIFAREGWLSAGAFWSRDAMHFQATQ
jgi:hypothetical protein